MQGRKKLSIGLLTSLLCLLAMFVSACGSTPSGPAGPAKPAAAPADKQIFRYPMGPDDFATLDPAHVQDTLAAYAVQSMFTGLVQFKDDGTVVDQLAASHKVSPDGLTYTFTLRPNLKFSDGTALTSKDVAYSINRALLPATKSEVAYYLNLVKDYDKITSGAIPTIIGDSLVTPDDNTIAITLSQPAAYFLQALTYPSSYVVEQKLIDQYADKWTDHLDAGGGDGPFKASTYDHTKGLTMVPNPNYYGAKPQIQKFEMLISGDTATTYKAYISGQYDLAGVPAANLPEAKVRKDYSNYPILVIRYLSMNYNAKPFDNIKIRQAFALALNKDLLVQTVLRGAVTPTNHLVPSGMAGYYPALKGPAGVGTAGDQTQAKALLAAGMQEAGYASISSLPPITFNYYTGNTTIANLVPALVQEWQTVLGVSVKTTSTTFSQLTKLEGATTGNASLQLWIGGWQADYPDPQDWLSTFFAKGASYNNNNYGQNSSSVAADQQTVQTEMQQADVNQDQAARIKAYNDAEQKLVNDVAWIPLYQSKGHTLTNPKLQGYTYNGLQITNPDDWANIYISQ